MKFKKYLLPILIIPILLTSCGSPNYSELNSINDEDFFKKEDLNYGVYYYSETCPQCKDTEPFLTTYLDRVSKNPDKYLVKNIYYINALTSNIEYLAATGTAAKELLRDKTIGATSIENVYQIGFPIFYVVEPINSLNTITEIHIGHKEIANYIKNIW